MIFVEQQPEPTNFDQDIRQKGLEALQNYQLPLPPTKVFWRRHNYWNLAHADLLSAYNNTCAYLAIRLFRVKSARLEYHSSVEHFIPKNIAPYRAYDWDNYLLVSSSANAKRDRHEVLDPRTISQNLFGLRLNSGVVYVLEGHSEEITQQAEMTIENIKLNCLEFTKIRSLLYKNYKASPQRLMKWSPFIYGEAMRQGKIELIA